VRSAIAEVITVHELDFILEVILSLSFHGCFGKCMEVQNVPRQSDIVLVYSIYIDPNTCTVTPLNTNTHCQRYYRLAWEQWGTR
jgi:hypothetical protein